jgi:DNA-binding NtrC family response regulator
MDKIKIKIINSDKNLQLQKRINKLLKNYKIKTESERNLKNFSNQLNLQTYDIAIITNTAIEKNNKELIDALKKISDKSPKTQMLFFVEEQEIGLASEALKAGTYHYAKLPVNDEELKLLIETAIEQQPRIIDNSQVTLKNRNRLGEIIGNSSSMQKVYDQIIQAAQTDIPVLILGETGTGKDMAAHAIHRMSKRIDNPYLPVNLGALPAQLVASELFGHDKGAFTGAMQQHKGVFEQGSKGTIFLDEIDSIDEQVQISLLRVLEQKKFKRLGGSRSINSDARILAATNEDLDNLVESGVFRIDLFYRLDVFRITLPALRERQNDIPLLADEMILKYSKTYHKNITSITQKSIDALMDYDWPGNVRELKNVIQRAVLVCNDEELNVDHLPPRFHNKTIQTPSISFKLGTSLDEVEREMVLQALAATNNNRKEAAKLLGISRRAIYNKLHKHNL